MVYSLLRWSSVHGDWLLSFTVALFSVSKGVTLGGTPLERKGKKGTGKREKASWSLGVKNEGKGKWKKKSWRSILDEARRNRGSEQISTACLLLGHAKCDGLVSVMPAQLVSSSLGERASRIFKQQPVAILLDARFRVNDAAFTPQNHMTDY
jgi:hypothetical protein